MAGLHTVLTLHLIASGELHPCSLDAGVVSGGSSVAIALGVDMGFSLNPNVIATAILGSERQ